MELFEKTFLNIPVIAWLLSFTAAAAMPLTLFYLFASPLLGFSMLVVLIGCGWFLEIKKETVSEEEETNPLEWIEHILYPVLPFAYLWIFSDQGFWAMTLYIFVTFFYAYQFARGYRLAPKKS